MKKKIFLRNPNETFPSNHLNFEFSSSDLLYVWETSPLSITQMNLSTVGATSQILWRCALAGEIPQGSGSTFANTNWKRDPPAGKLEWRSRWQPRPHDTNEWNLDRTELPDRNEITEIAGDGCSFSIKEAVCSGWVMSESVSAQTQ